MPQSVSLVTHFHTATPIQLLIFTFTCLFSFDVDILRPHPFNHVGCIIATMDENGHDKQLHVSVDALSLDRPNTLNLNGHVESENLLSVCSTNSSKSDLSESSFSSNDFTALRAKEGMDLDMGQLDTAAEIFDHSDIDMDETSLADGLVSCG